MRDYIKLRKYYFKGTKNTFCRVLEIFFSYSFSKFYVKRPLAQPNGRSIKGQSENNWST